MGRGPRPYPALLSEKLLHIRLALGMSQEVLVEKLRQGSGLRGIDRSSISGYELELREPPLPVLLVYARLANVHLEVLADDNLDLPERLPSSTTHPGIKRQRNEVTK